MPMRRSVNTSRLFRCLLRQNETFPKKISIRKRKRGVKMITCPYCGGDVKPPKVKKWETPGHAHGQCTKCPRKPRAKVAWNNAGVMHVSYSSEARKIQLSADDKKTVLVQKWISPRDWRAMQEGSAVLTANDRGVILLLYI
jgi:hypothetical protein